MLPLPLIHSFQSINQCTYYDSTLISCNLSLHLHNEQEEGGDDDEEEETALGQDVWFVRSFITQEESSQKGYLYVLISSCSHDSNSESKCYVTKIPLLQNMKAVVNYLAIYDRNNSETVIDLFQATTPVANSNINPTNVNIQSDWSILICYEHLQDDDQYELRKYPLSAMKFHSIQTNAQKITTSCINSQEDWEALLKQITPLRAMKMEESSVEKIVSNLQNDVLNAKDIISSIQGLNAARGVLFLSDKEGKIMLIDAETVEEEEDDDNAEEEEEDDADEENEKSLNESA